MALSARATAIGATFSAIVVENLTRTQIVQYAGASGDFNPLHTDEVYATAVAESPSVFGHGMLTMGLSGRALTDLVGADRVLYLGGRFHAPVWPGDTLTTTLTLASLSGASPDLVGEFSIETANQTGAVVFSGSARARLDP